jgi:phosphate transport system substrate-binding protein
VNVKRSTWYAGILALVLVLGAVGLTGCGGSKSDTSSSGSSAGQGSDLSGSLNVEGSDTMVNLANSWAEQFMTVNPNVNIAVKGGGSGNGIAALINGTADFADASREMKPEEIDQAKAKGVNPVETPVARDGIAVIVNPANGVKGLTIDQLGKIYRGEITNWKDVGGANQEIVLLSRDSSSGTYEYFKEVVVGKDKNYAKAAKLLPSTQAIVDETTGNEAAIGYIGVGYETPDIKVLEIDGVAASVATVLDNTYPISRKLYVYSNGDPTGVGKAYVDWILGADGQKVVEDEGFVPLGN